MTSSSIFDNPFGMVLMILPVLTFMASLIGQLLIKKKVIILGVVFVGYIIATYTVFNSSFLIWCFVYTLIALLGTLLADLILKFKRKPGA
jgi:hypothetical protein